MNVRPAVALGGCAVVLLLAIAIGASFGTDSVSLLTAVTDSASRDHDIVFAVRLPRVLLAALAGAGLSVVGVALQALLRNPLAEPFVLGVSGGSAFGATVAILMGLTGATVLGASLVPLAAFMGGLAATVLVHAFAAAARESRSTARSARASSSTTPRASTCSRSVTTRRRTSACACGPWSYARCSRARSSSGRS